MVSPTDELNIRAQIVRIDRMIMQRADAGRVLVAPIRLTPGMTEQQLFIERSRKLPALLRHYGWRGEDQDVGSLSAGELAVFLLVIAADLALPGLQIDARAEDADAAEQARLMEVLAAAGATVH